MLYTNERGTLSSIRLAEVDLGASERASAPPPPPAAVQPTQEERRPAALVLERGDLPRFEGTDFSSSSRGGNEEGEGGGGNAPQAGGPSRPTPGPGPANRRSSVASVVPGDAASPTATSSGSGERSGSEGEQARASVSVASWRDLGDYDTGISIFGTLRNDASSTARGIGVQVTVLNEAGTVLGKRAARVRGGQIPAGGSLNFRVSFPDISAYSTVEFEVSTRN